MASNSRSTKSQAALLTEGDEAEMPLAQFKSTEEKLQQLRTLMGDAKEGIRDDETAHLLINNQRPQVKLRVAKVQSQENQKCKQISKEKQQDECIESEQELSTAYFGHFGEDGGGNGVKNNTMNCEGGIIGVLCCYFGVDLRRDAEAWAANLSVNKVLLPEKLYEKTPQYQEVQ
ncbi:unnamed protein product [Ceratitis capitata]|nr:unnamed protein product [Ceratitis capitata]